jgi:histidyl-tRNA synthetase
MIAARQNELVFPARWWSFGPFWRYERPGRGRSREFFQWNIDMLGTSSPEADAELVAVAAAFLKAVRLSPNQSRIYVNDRRFMDSEFDNLEISAGIKREVSGLVDRRSKMDSNSWETSAMEIGLTSRQLDGLISLLNDKERWQKSGELVRFFDTLESLGIKEYVQFDPNIVRGLLYYTGTVFEAFDIGGDVRRAILGGGRYDNLLRDVGGEPLPCVGFAMGDVVINIILNELGLIPSLPAVPAEVLVTVFSQDLLLASYSLASDLRQDGLNVICFPEPAKLPRQFKFADRMGMNVVLVLGPDEAAAGKVTLKNLKTGTQEAIARSKINKSVRLILESH